jgi:hypothetical protein
MNTPTLPENRPNSATTGERRSITLADALARRLWPLAGDDEAVTAQYFEIRDLLAEALDSGHGPAERATEATCPTADLIPVHSPILEHLPELSEVSRLLLDIHNAGAEYGADLPAILSGWLREDVRGQLQEASWCLATARGQLHQARQEFLADSRRPAKAEPDNTERAGGCSKELAVLLEVIDNYMDRCSFPGGCPEYFEKAHELMTTARRLADEGARP